MNFTGEDGIKHETLVCDNCGGEFDSDLDGAVIDENSQFCSMDCCKSYQEM